MKIVSQVTNWEDTCPKVLILLGSNATSTLSSSAKLVSDAILALSGDGIEVLSQSAFYETPCFPEGAGPDFINVAIQLKTDLAPDALLARLHAVEDAFGRERPSRWAARSLDIDLIAYGDIILPDRDVLSSWISMPLEEQKIRAPECLILPHPRVQDRGFALIPLVEIAPDWAHPFLGKTLKEMCDALPEQDKTGVKPYKPT